MISPNTNMLQNEVSLCELAWDTHNRLASAVQHHRGQPNGQHIMFFVCPPRRQCLAERGTNTKIGSQILGTTVV
jgi:hypothetical protein